MHNLSHENKFYLHVNENSFSYERPCTNWKRQLETRQLEKDNSNWKRHQLKKTTIVQDNSEMAYCSLNPLNWVADDRLEPLKPLKPSIRKKNCKMSGCISTNLSLLFSFLSTTHHCCLLHSLVAWRKCKNWCRLQRTLRRLIIVIFWLHYHEAKNMK